MSLITDVAAKQKASRLYELCHNLWPDQLNAMFVAPRSVFRDWLNEKTGLEVDHITDKHAALDAWIAKLVLMNDEA